MAFIRSHRPSASTLIRQLLKHVVSLRKSGKWFFLSMLVGVVAGLGGIAFQVTEQLVFRFASQGIAGFSPKEAAGERHLFADPEIPFSPISLLLVMAAGGLASGWLVQRIPPRRRAMGPTR